MNNIKKYRGINNMTQENLAEKMNCARSLITYWENSEYNNLKPNQAQKLSQILNCSIIELYGDDNFKIVPKNDDERLEIIKVLTNDIENEDLKARLWEFFKTLKI